MHDTGFRISMEFDTLEGFAAFVAILRDKATDPDALAQLAALVETAKKNTDAQQKNVDKLRDAVPPA